MRTISLRLLGAAAISFALASLGTSPAFSQAVPDAAPAYTPEQLEKLVGPIALYPDELLAITLPSATYPLDLVKAQRFLDQRKKDPKLEPDKSLPDSVLKLMNYPDVIKLMNDDLDWTEALGEAVDTNEADVMDAIQAFRRKAQGAGNLKSNDKQVVVTEQQAIVIQPANPEVIYVPQYQPSSVVVYSATPYAWGYYPTPYPSYSYPYAPGAALATGLIVGAAIGGAWGMGWNNGHIENNINVNRNTNINTGNRNTNINAGNRPAQGGGGQDWRNNRAPTQTKSGAQARQGSVGSRPGDARAGGGASAAQGRTGAGFGGASASASNLGGARQSGSAGSMQNRSGSSMSGGSAFSGAGSSGASANRASSRGASSMATASPTRSAGGNSGARAGGGGGGARAGGGGGGRGGGGGGRGGGGRR